MKTFLLLLVPKRDYRQGCNFYIQYIEAENLEEAVKKTPAHWPVGDSAYKKLQCFVTVKGQGFAL